MDPRRRPPSLGVQQAWQGPAVVPSLANRRLACSLLLQQLMYYNIFWSTAWLIAMVVRICVRYSAGLMVRDPDIVRTALTLLWIMAEPLRLAAGYYGNLQESIPWLVIFMVLSLVPQTAGCFYLLLAAEDRNAFDKALQVVMAAFILAELAAAAVTMIRIFRRQKTQFALWEWALTRQWQQQAQAQAREQAARQQERLLRER